MKASAPTPARSAAFSLALAAFALAVLALACPAAAIAHDFWLSEIKAVPGAPIELTLGYGHDFPQGEPIPEENLATRFQPIALEGPGGPSALGRGAETRLLVGQKPLESGWHLAHGSTTPLFLTQTTEGWVIKAKNEVDAPLKSNLSAKYAKALTGLAGRRSAAPGPPGGP